MQDAQRRILDMLEAGKITPDQAHQLLSALGDATARAQSGSASAHQTQGHPQQQNTQAGTATMPSTHVKRYRYLCIVVEEVREGQPPKSLVNVRIPLALVRSGMKLASFLPQMAQEALQAAMDDKGIEFDTSKLKPEQLENLIESLGELEVDIRDGRERVRIHCE